MIEPERLATAQVHFVASEERALLPYRLARVVIIRHLELLTQLWNVLTLHTTTTSTHLVTATSAPANPEDFTSTVTQRMVKRNDQSHPTECFPPLHRQHQVVIIIFTQMAETLHRLHHLPTKSIIAAANEIDRWSRGRSRCRAINSRTELTALAFVSRAEGRPVSLGLSGKSICELVISFLESSFLEVANCLNNGIQINLFNGFQTIRKVRSNIFKNIFWDLERFSIIFQ